MALTSLEVGSFRCLENAKIDLGTASNLFLGSNGSGKTSLLEAVYVLAHGRSFRAGDARTLCRYGTRSFSISGRVTTAASEHSVQVDYRQGSLQLRIAGAKPRGFAEVASLMPVRIVDSSAHLLIEGSPAERRRFLDWGVFHVEHDFLATWRAFQRLLKQRNAALSAHATEGELDAWDVAFCCQAELMNAYRANYLQACVAEFRQAAAQLLDVELEVRFSPGWTDGLPLALALQRNRPRDRARELTTLGPHRADMVLLVNGHVASRALSRGQQKLLACALILGQVRYSASVLAPVTTLLIDDPAAELDSHNLEKLNEFIGSTPAQLLVTSNGTSSARITTLPHVFHVEQGNIRAVV